MTSRHVFMLVGLLGLVVVAGSPGSAATLKTLYSFCAQDVCADGNMPISGLIRDAAGNLFGTTEKGGNGSGGTVFELELSKGKYKFHQLYRFCALDNCADGTTPEGRLVVDTHGSLYGVVSGGEHGGGAIYKLTPRRSQWKFALLYSFCQQCADGVYPMAGLTYQGAQSGLPYDGTSPLYGTTSAGGPQGGGTVFQLTPTGRGATETVIYNFCSQADCADGKAAETALTIDGTGNLYGTTKYGGSTEDHGVAFELLPRNGAYKVLYRFCQLANCGDGDHPTNPLLMDANGDLFGTTETGGDSSGHGVLFRIRPNGNHSTETVLYKFCQLGSCKDGYDPLGALALDANGNLIGTTHWGGTDPSYGTIFRLHNSGERVLYDFCSLSNCTDGAAPYDGVVLDPAGNMYGTTITGGANDIGGVVYQFSP